MKYFLVTVIAIIELSICNGLLVDYRLTGACGPTTPKNCTVGGLLCETCTSLVLCTKSDGVHWSKTDVATCKSPQKCVNNQCTDEQDPVCDGTACLPFKCESTGIFPDPFFCNKYVMCVNIGTTLKPLLKPYTTDCENGFGYNVAQGLCSLPLTKCNTPYPVDVCKTVGQSAALKDNPSLYYVCEIYGQKNVVYPQLYKCPGNAVYQNYACVAPKL